MSCDLSYRGHKLTVSRQKDSFSFDISMQSSLWFESLHSTASATAPSTRQEKWNRHAPTWPPARKLYSVTKSWLKLLWTAKGLPSAHRSSLRSIFLSNSILWASFEVFTMNLHILVAQIYCTKAEPTVSTKRHLTPDWWNCWNTQLSLTHNLLQAWV